MAIAQLFSNASTRRWLGLPRSSHLDTLHRLRIICAFSLVGRQFLQTLTQHLNVLPRQLVQWYAEDAKHLGPLCRFSIVALVADDFSKNTKARAVNRTSGNLTKPTTAFFSPVIDGIAQPNRSGSRFQSGFIMIVWCTWWD